MDPVHSKFIDILVRYLDLQITLSLLLVTAIGSAVYYLWTKEKMSEFKRAWTFVIPFGLVVFGVYGTMNLYHSVLNDLREGGLTLPTMNAFLTFSWLQPSTLIFALLLLFLAMLIATKK